jgi:hypothetical protein
MVIPAEAVRVSEVTSAMVVLMSRALTIGAIKGDVAGGVCQWC